MIGQLLRKFVIVAADKSGLIYVDVKIVIKWSVVINLRKNENYLETEIIYKIYAVKICCMLTVLSILCCLNFDAMKDCVLISV